jgi:hypothetical protein
MEIERGDYRVPYFTKPRTEMLTEWHSKGSKNKRRTASQTKCQTILPEAYQMTPEKQTDNLPTAYRDGHREVDYEPTKAII